MNIRSASRAREAFLSPAGDANGSRHPRFFVRQGSAHIRMRTA